jgi:hypothetical protein
VGSQTKYGSKDLVYVPAKITAPGDGAAGPGVQLKYVFATNIPASDRTALGQIAVTDAFRKAPPPGTVLASSFPKPGRATKRTALRVTSSFYDYTKAAALKKDLWRLTKFKGNPRFVSSGAALVQTVYVTINGVNYAWNQPKVTETNITAATLTALGVRTATTANIDDLVTGCNYPKPPRAGFTLVSGDDVKSLSTYYDPSVSTLPAGWAPKGSGVLTIA